MTGTPQRLIDNLKRYRGAGLTIPLLWPPFTGIPTTSTIVDLRRPREDILPGFSNPEGSFVDLFRREREVRGRIALLSILDILRNGTSQG